MDDFPPGAPEPHWYRRLLERVRIVAHSIRERVRQVEPAADLIDSDVETFTVRRPDTDLDLPALPGLTDPTAEDAARLLLDLWYRSGGRMGLDEAVAVLEQGFGGRFLTDGIDAARVPDQQVLIQFAALAGPGVVYDSAIRAWAFDERRAGL